ncbi:NAD(P)H-hydrate dehydratase [Thalassotalea sediminis]|uniref:NAD(P)H-hydrate dehydratase n=1 Tax=Thalassotalea sediminis TaxID=1759089 RepID=UPI00257283F9|nr:NAD(P)H-hydrate dehydratase [Thalassotalea sediminis]
MPVTRLLTSLPQSAYCATEVLANEQRVASQQRIDLYALMEKAGQAVFSHIQEQYPKVTQLFVLAGKGNNGGDGLVIARLAYEAGLNVTVYLCAEEEQIKGDAAKAFQQLQHTNVTIIYQSELLLTSRFFIDNTYDLIVDALFGIGYQGELDVALANLIQIINQTDIATVSVDVPSGLNATTGYVATASICATETVTFIAVKQGLMTGQAADYVGELLLAGLSLNECFQQTCRANVFIQGLHAIPNKPVRSNICHKGNVGVLLAVGGNQGLPGAIRLASEAALRAGASLVAVSCHQENHQTVLAGRPELMLAPDSVEQLANSLLLEKAKVLLLGPGLGQNRWASTLFNLVLQQKKPLVIDADGLQLLAKEPLKRNDWVLTPHPGEAAALLRCSIADIEKDRFKAVKAIASQYGGVCVLKGAGSLISDGLNIWINTSGNSGMASGGMGDVLSGIIAALLMQLDCPVKATRLAVYIHGGAADIIANQQGKIGMLASDLFLPIQQLLNK